MALRLAGSQVTKLFRKVHNTVRLISTQTYPLLQNEHAKPSKPVRDPFKRSFPEEIKPDYELEGHGGLDEGEVIFPPPEQTFTSFEEVVDPDAWKAVERLLPRTTVPEPPQHASYPTPSGWIPPDVEKAKHHLYLVERNKMHNFPIHLEVFNNGTRKMTCIKRVRGDIWAFEADLRAFLEKRFEKPFLTQVDEVRTKVRVRGPYLEEVAEFLLLKGF